jgi:hypothetical protein
MNFSFVSCFFFLCPEYRESAPLRRSYQRVAISTLIAGRVSKQFRDEPGDETGWHSVSTIQANPKQKAARIAFRQFRLISLVVIQGRRPNNIFRKGQRSYATSSSLRSTREA